MDLQLKGKTALVLAASKGLGKACAIALASEGADVVIGARNAETLNAAAEEIRTAAAAAHAATQGPAAAAANHGEAGKVRILAIPVDVRQPEAATAIVDATVKEFGKIDILVNNAGGPPFGKFESFDEAAWQSAFELSLLSTIRFSRLVIPHMRKTGSGRIINIVSLSVKTFLADSVLSTSLRMGVVGMAKLLSNELGPDQITVNNVAPGLILTDRVKDTLPFATHPGATLEQLLAERAKDIPLRRIGRPEELAAMVAFLASPLAGYITGATIQVDGGAVRSPY
jgi:3-oxoacyl-[acyl-carrier protein] reductase